MARSTGGWSATIRPRIKTSSRYQVLNVEENRNCTASLSEIPGRSSRENVSCRPVSRTTNVPNWNHSPAPMRTSTKAVWLLPFALASA